MVAGVVVVETEAQAAEAKGSSRGTSSSRRSKSNKGYHNEVNIDTADVTLQPPLQ